MSRTISDYFPAVPGPLVALRYPILLIIAAGIYLVGYLQHPAQPGSNPAYPLGWWGWADQGEYLMSANAMRHFDWGTASHYYPPVYPAIGALFVGMLPMHAFLPIDLLCFLLFIFFFVDFAAKYISWVAAVCALILSFYVRLEGGWLPHDALLNTWVEPWTTTPVAAVISYLVWSIDRSGLPASRPGFTKLAVWGCFGGIVAATRPLESIVLVPLYLVVLTHLLTGADKAGQATSAPMRVAQSAVLIFSGIFWVLLFLLFNWLVHGTLEGRYFAVNAQGNGFHVGDLVEKYISIFVSSGELYGTPHEAIYKRMLWMALSLPAMVYVAVKGSRIFRLIALMAAVQVMLYLPYSDLLPTGIWIYRNIHYFKWMFPYLALFIFWMIVSAVKTEALQRKRDWVFVFSVVVSLPILLVHIRPIEVNDVRVKVSDDQGVAKVELTVDKPAEMELVTLPVLNGEYSKVYFGAGNQVAVNGKPLKFIRDYRFLPRSDGGVALLFIRPVVASTVLIRAKEMSLQPAGEPPRVFRARLGIGWPAWAKR